MERGMGFWRILTSRLFLHVLDEHYGKLARNLTVLGTGLWWRQRAYGGRILSI